MEMREVSRGLQLQQAAWGASITHSSSCYSEEHGHIRGANNVESEDDYYSPGVNSPLLFLSSLPLNSKNTLLADS